MKLSIKMPEGRGYKNWRTWEIKLNDQQLDGVRSLRLDFDEDGLVTASMIIDPDELELEGDIMAELQAIVESRRK